jgi:hypothetical protein
LKRKKKNCTSITLSSRKVLGQKVEKTLPPRPTSSQGSSAEKCRSLKNLASRLAQESQKVDAWNGKISRLFSMHLDRVQKARKREYEAYKRREGALTREKNKLLAQNRELKLALDDKR